MGQPVLSPGLTLVEDPHRPRISSSRPFDAEGLPTARRVLVAGRGAAEVGCSTWQRGASWVWLRPETPGRGTGAPPSPVTTNIDLTPGSATKAELIAQMGTGLLVTSMIGQTISATTGDYSRGASGWWVEGGRLSHPVQECTVAGNLREMLRRIVPANDARPHLSLRVPSILIDGMTLAGA
jgi:PmbA protein